MRNKLLIFSLVTVISVTVLAVAAGVAVFALTGDAPVQTEEVSVDPSLEVVPLEVEPVKVVNPVFKREHSKYAGVDGEGGCPYSHSKAQLVKAETPAEDQVVESPLLTLAE